MKHHEKWRPILDVEVKRWSAKSYSELRSELSQALLEYEVEFDSKQYQVEVEVLENTQEYIHVMIAVDDGSLPASIFPLSHSFIRYRSEANSA